MLPISLLSGLALAMSGFLKVRPRYRVVKSIDLSPVLKSRSRPQLPRWAPVHPSSAKTVHRLDICHLVRPARLPEAAWLPPGVSPTAPCSAIPDRHTP